MSKYVLTNNKIEYDGHTLYQIKRAGWSDQYGGYIEDIGILSQDDDSWVEEGAYVYGESLLQGKVIIKKGTVVKDSELYGTLYIFENCTIINSCIKPIFSDKMTVIKKETVIQNKNFRTVGTYDGVIFNDGKFEAISNNNTEVLLSDNYFRVNCQHYTYESAWEMFHNKDSLQKCIDQFFPHAPLVFTQTNLNWLEEICAKELLRKYKIPHKE